ncbi:MAG: winged helix-turn-helix domain-containing protein [Candidatus Brocadiales bacterium]
MVKTIRIDDDVWRTLQKKAEALIDTPNSVLRRILRIDKNRVLPTRRPRIPGVTKQSLYRKPILETLLEMGGSGDKNAVLGRVHEKMKGKFNSADYEKTSTGEVRWENTAAWERFKMVKDGLLKADSPRGIWEITEKGRKSL